MHTLRPQWRMTIDDSSKSARTATSRGCLSFSVSPVINSFFLLLLRPLTLHCHLFSAKFHLYYTKLSDLSKTTVLTPFAATYIDCTLGRSLEGVLTWKTPHSSSRAFGNSIRLSMYSRSHAPSHHPPPLALQSFRIPRKPCSLHERLPT